jgi:hypothetical protein
MLRESSVIVPFLSKFFYRTLGIEIKQTLEIAERGGGGRVCQVSFAGIEVMAF